jgi:hypothetical protein
MGTKDIPSDVKRMLATCEELDLKVGDRLNGILDAVQQVCGFMGEGAKLVRSFGALQFLNNEAEKARGVDGEVLAELQKMKLLKLAEACQVQGYTYEGKDLTASSHTVREHVRVRGNGETVSVREHTRGPQRDPRITAGSDNE